MIWGAETPNPAVFYKNMKLAIPFGKGLVYKPAS